MQILLPLLPESLILKGMGFLLVTATVAAILLIHHLAGKPFLFLRWSFLYLVLRLEILHELGQVGDGREKRAVDYVLKHSTPGHLDSVLRAIDRYARYKKFLINIGEAKGRILGDLIRRKSPMLVLELGTYIGYSALLIAKNLRPGAKVVTVEFNPQNAELARMLVRQAGVEDRVEVVAGSLDDGGETAKKLERDHGLGAGTVGVLFIDHDKNAYVRDLILVLEKKWLKSGAVVLADNMGIPNVPEYRAYMSEVEGRLFKTRELESVFEHQKILKDRMFESDYLG